MKSETRRLGRLRSAARHGLTGYSARSGELLLWLALRGLDERLDRTGATAFTRMPFDANCWPSALLKFLIAALVIRNIAWISVVYVDSCWSSGSSVRSSEITCLPALLTSASRPSSSRAASSTSCVQKALSRISGTSTGRTYVSSFCLGQIEKMRTTNS